MSWVADVVERAIKTLWELRPTKPVWRWGHGYEWQKLTETWRCIYCARVSTTPVRVSSPPCPGPPKGWKRPAREQL
jgi:hypothetical protein